MPLSPSLSDTAPGDLRGAARIWRRQSPHSLFVCAAAVMLSITLIVDLLVHDAALDTGVVASLLVSCLAFAVVVWIMGSRFPRWLGLSGAALFMLATVYFVSPFGDEQSAVTSLQELPLLGLYFAWFVAPRRGRLYFYASLVAIGLSCVTNPIFWESGALGPTSPIQAIVTAIFCFEAGGALWARTMRRIRTDALTGALNRAGFLDRLTVELRRRERGGPAPTLVVLDFDEFKQLNDTHGHEAGDLALEESVGEWRRGLRPTDVIVRTGGDEFAILLPRTDEGAAECTIRRLRESAGYDWTWGIAEAGPGETAESLFQRADERLYAAKRGPHEPQE